MPYKFETLKFKVGKEKNRNRKLTDEQRQEIKQLYGLISQRKLAKLYNVSRRLIQFIGDVEKEKRNKELYKLNSANGKYYNKNRHKGYMKTHRKYKKKLFKIENEK